LAQRRGDSCGASGTEPTKHPERARETTSTKVSRKPSARKDHEASHTTTRMEAR